MTNIFKKLRKKWLATCLAIIFTLTFGGFSNVIFASTADVAIEAWGAGGGGGRTGGSGLARGGGGGAFSKETAYTVSVGTYSVSIGTGGTGQTSGAAATAGGDTYFVNSSTVLAKGGDAGNSNGTPQGYISGGLAASGVGDTKYDGGGGGNSTSLNGGHSIATGGGSGAGTTGAGNNGQTATGQGNFAGGAAKADNGGKGGDGGYPGCGGGDNYGGGGGASTNNAGSSGQGCSGANGAIRIIYPTGTLTATGGTITTEGANTVHTFTSSGTFEVTAVGGAAEDTNTQAFLIGI